MKTSSSDLFRLIKSMTKSEKGYFKKIANITRGEKVYIRLFDAIDAQTKYDEAKIKDKFGGEQFVKQISVAKNNLYTQILKSLNQYSISSNLRFELRSGINNAEILFNKGLVEQSLKLISRLKQQASETEEFDVLLQLMNLEKSILLKSFTENQERLDEIYELEIETLEKRKNYIQYQKLFNRSFYLITKFGHIRSGKDENLFLETINNRIMKNENSALSIMAKIHFHEIFFHYYVAKMMFDDALKCTSRSLELMEKNRSLLTTRMEKYLSLYQNHILQYFYLRNFAEVENQSRKIKTILYDKRLNIPERVKVNSLGKLLCITFVAHMNSGNFDESAKAFKETSELLNNNDDLLDNSIRIVLFNLSAYYNFITSNYTEALKWINKLLNDAELKYFVEMICNARWFELLIHFELKNYDYIDNILKTNTRYINKREKMYGVEKVMIKFFLNIVNTENPAGTDIFRALLRELEKVTHGSGESDYGVDYYNVTGWVRSKIGKIPFKEYLEHET